MTSTEDLLRETLHRHEADDYDVTDLLTRVRQEIGQADANTSARPSRLTAAALALTAVVVAVAAVGWWVQSLPGTDHPERDNAAVGTTPLPTKSGAASAAVPPPGMKFVGFRGLMLTVPESWGQTTSCHLFQSGAVHYADFGPDELCPGPLPAGLVAFNESIVGPPSLLGRTIPWGKIGGRQLLITALREQGDHYSQALALPTEQFYVRVLASHRPTVAQIVQSAAPIPRGYTVVPTVESMTPGVAKSALTDAGLRTTRRPVNMGFDPQRVVRVRTQLPAVGSVVPAGSRVQIVTY